MLHSLLGLALAAGMAASPPDSTVTQFVAVLGPEGGTSGSLANAEGTATITMSPTALQYRVSLNHLKHVSDVAVIDAGRAVQLASPGDSRGTTLELNGTVTPSVTNEVPFDKLMADMREGKAQVVVFTTNEPGGAIAGTLVLGAPITTPAPVPQLGVPTT